VQCPSGAAGQLEGCCCCCAGVWVTLAAVGGPQNYGTPACDCMQHRRLPGPCLWSPLLAFLCAQARSEASMLLAVPVLANAQWVGGGCAAPASARQPNTRRLLLFSYVLMQQQPAVHGLARVPCSGRPGCLEGWGQPQGACIVQKAAQCQMCTRRGGFCCDAAVVNGCCLRQLHPSRERRCWLRHQPVRCAPLL
jgi:hypothetical protein